MPRPTAKPIADRYHPRELSWLAFNRRVLEEAEDAAKPLLERAKFLAIVASNLDEFVMVRVAELWEGCREGKERESSRTLLEPLRAGIHAQMKDQYTCWRTSVAPALAKVGLDLVPVERWTATDRETLQKYYDQQLEPILTPQAVDPARPFPRVKNRGIAVAVRLQPEAGGEARNALVSVPQTSRLVALVGVAGRYALVEDVVMAFLDHLFPGYELIGRCLFRVTRDGSLDIDEQDAPDLLSEIEAELAERERGHAVRLEVMAGGNGELQQWLQEVLELDPADRYTADGPLDLTFLFGATERIDRADLRDPPAVTVRFPSEEEWEDPFARIRQGDLLLHHPYHQYAPVVELIERSAEDPKVLAIKQTLYRVSGNSSIVKALIRAATRGKQVTVLIELKARFDEAANIRWARALEDAGAHVVYGLIGFKVHAKLLMIIRREEDGIIRYCHLGTGNYNDKTARLYTDLSYLTANEAVGRDVAALFNMLTGYSRPPEWERLAVSPLTMRSRAVEWIRREADHARARASTGRGPGGRIIAKFNSMVDPGIADELYAASNAGVQIDLIVRGMCILKAGVPGLSENIRVRSIIGRYLEHSRIFFFANAGNPVYAISSADWMTRNLDWRVECLTPIVDDGLRRHLQRILDISLEDNCQARLMQPDGTYVRLKPKRGDKPRPSQELLAKECLAVAAAEERDEDNKPVLRFKPRRKGQ